MTDSHTFAPRATVACCHQKPKCAARRDMRAFVGKFGRTQRRKRRLDQADAPGMAFDGRA
jgi:hypothetical protein